MPVNQKAQRSGKSTQLAYIGNPLDFSVRTDVEGKTTQVYYDNTGEYSPDRRTTPTRLIPIVQAADPSTGLNYNVAINQVRWYEISRGNNQPVLIVSGEDYVIDNNTLIIYKNVHPNSPIDIREEINFYDPRGTGKPYTLYDTTALNSSKDADILQARLNIISETTEKYDPIIDNTSLFTFQAQVILADIDISADCQYYWYAKDAYTQNYTLIDDTVSWTDTTSSPSVSRTRPRFFPYGMTAQPTGKGQGTDTIVLDAKYARSMQLKLKARPLYAACIYPTGNPVSHQWYERRARTSSDPAAASPYVYFLSQDTAVDPDKVYYNTGTVVNPEGNPQEQQWFEWVSNAYVPTQDTSVVSGKTYYTSAMITYVDEVFRGLDWVFPNVDAKSVCDNGGRMPIEDMEMWFTALVDTTGASPRHFSDADLQQYCILKWWKLVNGVETFLAFGPYIHADSADLKRISSNQNIVAGDQVSVYYDLFFKENLELWTYNGEPVTYSGELAFAPVITLS